MSKCDVDLMFQFQPVVGLGLIKIDNPTETYWTLIVPFLQIHISILEVVE